MSGQLNALGVIGHFAGAVGGRLTEANLGWPAVFGLLNGAYMLLHYMFASQTAHVGALYGAFLAMMLAGGVPAVLAAVSLGVMSNLFGSLTHYGSGQGAVYYGAGALCSVAGLRGGGWRRDARPRIACFALRCVALLWCALGIGWGRG